MFFLLVDTLFKLTIQAHGGFWSLVTNVANTKRPAAL